jgi:hypothetical protein
MSEDAEKQEFIDAILAEIMMNDLFNKDEAMALTKSIRSETPDGLPDAFDGIVTWARKVRSQQAILDTILQLGKEGLVGVSFQDGEVALRLEP